MPINYFQVEPGAQQFGENLLRGMLGVQTLQNQRARNYLYNMEIQREQQDQAGLQQYGQTGDMSALQKTNPLMAMKLNAEQLKIANAATEYWDNSKSALTLDNYPKWREETIKRFPMMNSSMLPEPSTFKTPDDFNRFKYQKEMEVAKLKQMGMAPKVHDFGPDEGTKQWVPGQGWMRVGGSAKKSLEQIKEETRIKEQIKSEYKEPKESPEDKPPHVVELFDEKGNPYKAQWNRKTHQYEKLGFSKAAKSTKADKDPGKDPDTTQGMRYYLTFTKALKGPKRAEALAAAKQDYPLFYERAKQDKLLNPGE